MVPRRPPGEFVNQVRHAKNGLSLHYKQPDVRSIGAMIQNMLCAAPAIGLGAPWICHVPYANPTIHECLSRKQALRELTEWRSEA